MAPPSQMSEEQLDFLISEDSGWAVTKAGSGTLKDFYLRTTITFLKRWPADLEATTEEAGGDVTAAKRLAEADALKRITNWYSHRHRQTKPAPPVPVPLLDLSGKNSRKKPPLQKWQAFSALYYRPHDSPFRSEVKTLFEKRHDPGAVGFLTGFLPPDTDISTIDRLTFLSAFMRERCTRMSNEEEQQVQAYIKENSLLAAENKHHPWLLDDDYEDKPLLAENRYIQQRIDELPRVAQRALEEIEKQTGFKGLILLGGLTPGDNGEISTHIHYTGNAVTTGLSFIESWAGFNDCHDAFVEWLQISYSDDEKSRRKGCSKGHLLTATPVQPDEPGSPVEPVLSDEPPPNVSTLNTSMPNVPMAELPMPNDSMPDTSTPDVLLPNGPIALGERETPRSLTNHPSVPLPINSPTIQGPEQASTAVSPIVEEGVLSPAVQGELPLSIHPSPPSTPTTSRTTPIALPGPAAVIEPYPLEGASSFPGFITTDAVQHLNSVSGEPRWAEIVRNYLKLESQFPARRTGRLSMQTRPKEVAEWGRRQKSIPSIPDAEEFHQRWVAWWQSCQPKWRSAGTWPYARDNARGKDWARLNVTGPHGLFAVVMSASWWADSMDLGSLRDVFSAAVDDLHWVIENLVDFNSQSHGTQSGPVIAPLNRFPGHGEREVGKRLVKPSYKVSSNW